MADDWKKKIGQIQQNKFFCPRPFVEIISNIKEIYGPCCYSRMPSNTSLADQPPFDYWSSDQEFQNLRRHMLGLSDHSEVVNSACGFCLTRESQNIPSPRFEYNSGFSKGHIEGQDWSDDDMNRLADQILQWNGESDWKAMDNSVAVRMRLFGNFCNLRCVSCSPSNSSRIQSEYLKIIDLEPENMELSSMKIVSDKVIDNSSLLAAQQNVIDNIKSVRSILLIGGEPLLTPGHFDWLDKIVTSGHSGQINLRYQTNLTELHRYAERIFDYKQHFDGIYFIGSVDCIGQKNDYVRWGSSWNQIQKNIDTVFSHGIGITINITTTWLTAQWVGELWHEIHKRWGIRAIINGSVVSSPYHLSPRHLPQALKEKTIESLKRYVDHPNRYSVLTAELSRPQDVEQFKLSQRFLETLDRSRKTDWLDFFPEFRPYLE